MQSAYFKSSVEELSDVTMLLSVTPGRIDTARGPYLWHPWSITTVSIVWIFSKNKKRLIIVFVLYTLIKFLQFWTVKLKINKVFKISQHLLHFK